MLLVVGLGNPGPRYRATRHNAGFILIDALAAAQNVSLRQKFNGEFEQCELAGQRLGLLKPQTFMNRSGQSVRACCDFYRVPPEQVLVAHDELDVACGQLRFKLGGGEAGHNGLRDISKHLGTKDYYRLRLGIGRPPSDFRGKTADFVLQDFARAEGPQVETLISRGVEAVRAFAQSGADAAMNEYNRKT